MGRLKPAALNLPFDDWRTGQWDLIQKIVGAKTKFVLVQAPPGVGKSPVAVGAARLHPHPSMFLTSTKQLQEQYMRLGGMVDVRGRSNFECNMDTSLMADWGDCVFGKSCDLAGPYGQPGCNYYDQARRSWQAEEVVTNYSYALRTKESYNPKFLICDEAHNLPGEMSSLMTMPLTKSGVYGYKLPPPPTSATWEQWQVWGKSAIRKVPDPLTFDDKKARYTVERLKEAVKLCSDSLGECSVTSRPWGWEITPVWASMNFGLFLAQWRSHPKVLLMSATILDPLMFCQRLGLDLGEVTFFDVPSPFSLERRPLRYVPITKVGISTAEDGISALIQKVDEILSSHPSEKGIIHTVSFKLASEVIQRTRHSGRLLTHTAKDREKVFAQFQQTQEPRVLVSPSAMVGLDAPYDGCRFQIILKLPFPDKSDPLRVAQSRSRIGKDLSLYDTAANLVQAYGRAMRAEDDWGVTYLLDESYGWFRKMAKRFLPIWFTEAVRQTDELGPIKGVS